MRSFALRLSVNWFGHATSKDWLEDCQEIWTCQCLLSKLRWALRWKSTTGWERKGEISDHSHRKVHQQEAITSQGPFKIALSSLRVGLNAEICSLHRSKVRKNTTLSCRMTSILRVTRNGSILRSRTLGRVRKSSSTWWTSSRARVCSTKEWKS